LRDNITEELVYPQEQCVEMAEDSLQSSREDQVKNGETELAEERPQQEERVTSVIDDNNLPCEGHRQVGMQPILEVQMADEQDSVMIQCEAEVAVTSGGKQVNDTVEEQIRAEEHPTRGNGEEFQIDELQKGGDSEQKILEKAEKESAENTEAEEQNYYLTEEQVERIEHSSEQPQQEEQQTKVNEKEVMLVVDSESQQEQGVKIIEDQNQACTEKDVLQDDRVGTEPVPEE
ncbi:hypothetical protein Tco_1088259, partial [Tanacetum coccineum]